MVSLAQAATEHRALPGTIEKPGFNGVLGLYTGSQDNTNVRRFKERFRASYVAINTQIPGQAVVVNPAGGSVQTGAIDDNNIESVARNYLLSIGLIPTNCSLELTSKMLVMGKEWFVNFHKSFEGIPIEDAGLNLAVSTRGMVSFFWGDLEMSPAISGNFLMAPETDLEIAGRGLDGSTLKRIYLGKSFLPLYFGDRIEYHPVHNFMIVTDGPYAEWKVSVDAENGEILQRVDQVYYDQISGNVSGLVQPLFPFDDWVPTNFHDLDLNFDGYDPITTDSAGNYILDTPDSNPLNVDVFFRGPYLRVMNSSGPESEIYTTVAPPDTFNIYWEDSNSLPEERDAFHSGVLVHNWIDRLDPGLGVMDFPMVCNVDVNGTCNAFWSSLNRTINFYMAGGGCANMAQIADVIYHEYGHGVTDLQTAPYGPNGAMHEGFSDYLACTITNQPHVGRGFYINPPDAYLRNLDNNMRYPDSLANEPHHDGMIISGALWHTRQALSPYPMGYADSLWHFARYARTQDFEPYFWAYLTEDDDDGDLSNGTPHAWDIFHNFGDRHGIGPGTRLSIVADTILDSEDTTRTFPLTASITSYFGLRPDSVIIFYDNGGGYTPVHMSQNGEDWTGEIPAQRNNTHVNYYILAVDSAGFRGTFPDGAPDNHFSFFVGPDLIPPAMALIQGPLNTVNLIGPYGPFVISATDISGIDPLMVRMRYTVNHESERIASLTAGPDSNQFILESLNLFRNLFTGDTIHYYFTCLDGAHHQNQGRLPDSGTFSLAMVTEERIEDFENGLGRWVVGDGWVIRNDGYYSPHSIWFSSPAYPNNANSSITMNFDYDLSPYRHGSVTFYRKNIIAHGDTCFVEASNNGGTSWTRVGAICDTLMPIFTLTQFDISSVLRSDYHHYKVRFHFVSDDTIPQIGIFIDDVGWSVEPALDEIQEPAQLPRELALAQNYPNPFNPQTRIDFSLPAESQVRLEIFDLLGRRVTLLVNKQYQTGRYSVVWNGQDARGNPAASGIYFYRLTTDQGVRQAKMTLLR
jgi:hypothetical protein